MSATYRKICIVGPGAVGGMMAVLLARAGYEVSALARPERAKRINAGGITLLTEGKTLHARVRAESTGAELGQQDLVVITVKSQNLKEVAQDIMAMCGPKTPLVFMLNGVPWWFFQGKAGALSGTKLPTVDPDGFLERTIPLERIVWGTVECSVHALPNETVEHNFLNTLVIGRPDGSMEGMDEIAGVFRAAGYNAPVTDSIRDAIWLKLQGNAGANPLSAITGGVAAEMARDPLLAELSGKIRSEIRDVGAKIGLKPAEDYIASPRLTASVPMNIRTSMLQDMERGRTLELDAILAAPVEIADKAGVPVPFSKAVLGILRTRLKTLNHV